MNLKHWESYYRGGALVSCPTNPEPNYTMEVRQTWVDFFSGLDDGSRILDLGTGNGAVALIAKEVAGEAQRRFEIHGVDLAEIDPLRYVPDAAVVLAGIDFHAGVSTEELPFGDQYFSAISGQYIVEYTNIEKTLAEAWRVLKPAGACQFILHHADSIVVQNAQESLRQVELVFDRTRVLQKFRRYCERARKSPARAETARSDLYRAGEILQGVASQSTNPVLLKFVIDSISALLANRSRLTEGQLIHETGRFEQELRSWVLRLRDLASAAPSREQVDQLLATATKLGFEAPTAELQMQGGENLVGWRIVIRKPDEQPVAQPQP